MNPTRVSVLVIVVGICCIPIVVAGASTVSDSTPAIKDSLGHSQQPVSDNWLLDTIQISGNENESEQIQREQSMAGAMTTFMHSNTESTSASVEAGLFDAAMANAHNETKEAIVADRTETIETKLETLEEEHAVLAAQTAVADPSYQARETRLLVRIASLDRAIVQTQAYANTTGVDTARLESVQSELKSLDQSVVETTTSSLLYDWQRVNETPSSVDMDDTVINQSVDDGAINQSDDDGAINQSDDDGAINQSDDDGAINQSDDGVANQSTA